MAYFFLPTDVISKSLPLRMDFRELHKMVALYAKARRPQMTAEAKAWRHEFLSWKSIKHFLEHNLHDQNIRDILRTYVPHDATLKFDGTMGKLLYFNTQLGQKLCEVVFDFFYP